MKKALVIISALSLFIIGLWFIAIPESLIVDLIDGSLNKEYIYLQSKGLKKGLFYTFSAERITLKKKGIDRDSDETLLAFRDVHGGFEFTSLVRLSPELSFNCRMDEGDVTGKVGLAGENSLTITGSNIHINEIPFLGPLGIHGEGILSGSFLIGNRAGELKFSITDARFKSTSLEGIFLPLNIFHDIKGVATINDETLEVQSLSMSGRGVYGRIKGSIREMNLNMTFELMTDSSFKSDPFFHAILEQYKVSPGYYVVPLRRKILQTEGD